MDQGWLLPPSEHDVVPAGDLARWVRDTAREGLDLAAIFGSCQEERGYPPYHPGIMVALRLDGYSRGSCSSRQLARACEARSWLPVPTLVVGTERSESTSWR